MRLNTIVRLKPSKPERFLAFTILLMSLNLALFFAVSLSLSLQACSLYPDLNPSLCFLCESSLRQACIINAHSHLDCSSKLQQPILSTFKHTICCLFFSTPPTLFFGTEIKRAEYAGGFQKSLIRISCEVWQWKERKSVRFFWMRVCMDGHLTSFYGTKKERKKEKMFKEGNV